MIMSAIVRHFLCIQLINQLVYFYCFLNIGMNLYYDLHRLKKNHTVIVIR